MKLFDIFRKKDTTGEPLTLEKLVEMKILTREEMLLIKKERATREWQNEAKILPTGARSHHRERT